jgi:hypothetical protein
MGAHLRKGLRPRRSVRAISRLSAISQRDVAERFGCREVALWAKAPSAGGRRGSERAAKRCSERRRGAAAPDPCEASQRSMLRWAGWRMRHPEEPAHERAPTN